MPGVLRSTNYDLFSYVWEMCIRANIRVAHGVLLGCHSVGIFDDIEVVIRIIYQEYSEGCKKVCFFRVGTLNNF